MGEAVNLRNETEHKGTNYKRANHRQTVEHTEVFVGEHELGAHGPSCALPKYFFEIAAAKQRRVAERMAARPGIAIDPLTARDKPLCTFERSVLTIQTWDGRELFSFRKEAI